MTRYPAAAARPACGEQNDLREILLSGGQGSYFFGARADFIYIISIEGNGGTPFTIYDAQTAKAIYGDGSFLYGLHAVAVADDVLTFRYLHMVDGRCSIVSGGNAYWLQIAREAHLPRAIARQPARSP